MISVREARDEDASVVFEGYLQTAQNAGLLVSHPSEVSLASVLADIRTCQGPKGYFVVAEKDSAVVGHAYLSQMSMLAVQHVYRLTTIVHPAHTGNGIGRQLLAALHSWAQSNPNCQKIELLVRASNAKAVHLYRSVGYIEEGRLRDRVKDTNGHLHDDLAMAFFPKDRAT